MATIKAYFTPIPFSAKKKFHKESLTQNKNNSIYWFIEFTLLNLLICENYYPKVFDTNPTWLETVLEYKH